MITERVQNLFDFIDWLHSQTEYFLSQQQLVDELNEIRAEQNKLSSTKHFKDREKFDSLQRELLEKFAVVETRIINPIYEKIKFYDVTDISTPIVNLKALEDLLHLKNNYDEQDLIKIQKAKNQYIIYRVKTHWQPYFSFQLFFSDLDRELYEYFKFFEQDNEVEYISTKTVKAESLEDLVMQFTGRKNLTNKPEPVANGVSVKASLKPEVIEPLFNILKDFFEKEQQDSFKTILETFENSPEKLLFKANGNRLADTFKRLIETDLITGMQKKDLINFVAANFTFFYRGEVKEFKIKTLEQTISEDTNPCKKPIIDIVKGEVIRNSNYL